jgi:hypothetical protein
VPPPIGKCCCRPDFAGDPNTFHKNFTVMRVRQIVRINQSRLSFSNVHYFVGIYPCFNHQFIIDPQQLENHATRSNNAAGRVLVEFNHDPARALRSSARRPGQPISAPANHPIPFPFPANPRWPFRLMPIAVERSAVLPEQSAPLHHRCVRAGRRSAKKTANVDQIFFIAGCRKG